jgi:hypothetical protein
MDMMDKLHMVESIDMVFMQKIFGDWKMLVHSAGWTR